MTRSLPLLSLPKLPPNLQWPEVLTELQALGLRWIDPEGPGLRRIGGAGPSDHKAISIEGQTLMVPIATHAAQSSPYAAVVHSQGTGATLTRFGAALGEIDFPKPPRFYTGETQDGIPYWKIATLHSKDVLATTLLQTCTRFGHRDTSCQFCSIGQSLSAKRTIARKTPEQLAEVVQAAVELDGVRQLIITTGTPATNDRGARVLAEAARAVRGVADIPIQAQCEPPDDHGWFSLLREAGVDSLGMHLEAVTQDVRRRIMPGKAEIPVETYFEAFAEAVDVFGRGQVSTYILAGLGDPAEAIVSTAGRLIALGVYPFVVPFVPITGTPLEHHPPPDARFLQLLLDQIAALLEEAELSSHDMKAGCGRCGACSTLQVREKPDREMRQAREEQSRVVTDTPTLVGCDVEAVHA